MKFLHSMIRVKNLEETKKFFCDIFGFYEVRRIENEKGRFTIIFLSAPGDKYDSKNNRTPLVELTYNWPDENGVVEDYQSGRNFGHLAFAVSNIYETCKLAMDNGVVINRPPRDGYMAFLKTPDGISIELLQEGGAIPPKEPWISMENIGTW